MKIGSSGKKVTFDRLNDGVNGGHAIASVVEAVMDEEFIKKSRHDWCWLSGNDVPTETGWYEVDRAHARLSRISRAEAEKLEWHERLFVYASGHAAVNQQAPLALYMGDEYADGRLSGLYLCGPDVLTWVAAKEV